MGLKIDKTNLEIGSRVFAVNKHYVDNKLNGARIKVCTVKTFQNKDGVIQPVLKEVGNSKFEIEPTQNYLYFDLNKALKAIKP